MPFTPPRSVVSGKPYVIQWVGGRQPERLDDFAGDTTFVIDLDGEEYRVCGPGATVDGSMRVFEKCDDGVGKDIRVWLVSEAAEVPRFTATHVGVDVPPQAMRGGIT